MVESVPEDADDADVDDASHCHGCGRPLDECARRPCGHGGPHDEARFCRRCGWRLRDIAVVPGVGGRWCRQHGVQPG
jgi:hypothetical protein